MLVPFEFDSLPLEEKVEMAGTEAVHCWRSVESKTLRGRLEGTARGTFLVTSFEPEAPIMRVGVERYGSWVALSVVNGRLDGREGSFIFHYGGWQNGLDVRLFGFIVPGSGTGDLEGITGSVLFPHNPPTQGIGYLDYHLPEHDAPAVWEPLTSSPYPLQSR